MKKATVKNRYSELSGQYSFIARACGCSADYVKILLKGSRTIKTDRAAMAKKIFSKADQMLEIANN